MPSREARKWQHHRAANEQRQIRKQIKRNRKPKRVRRKNWMPDSFDDPDEFYDLPQRERITPRGEQELRQTRMAEALAALKNEADAEQANAATVEVPGQQGVVVEVSSSLCRVDLDGKELVCSLRGSLSAQDTGFTNVVATGDRVIVSQNGAARGVVEAVLPRRGILARHHQLAQILVVPTKSWDVIIVAKHDARLAGGCLGWQPTVDARKHVTLLAHHLIQCRHQPVIKRFPQVPVT